MNNLYRGPNAPRPTAERLAQWEHEAAFIYRAQVLERLSTRPLARETQKDVDHATRILALVAEVDRLRVELSVSEANRRDQEGTVAGLLGSLKEMGADLAEAEGALAKSNEQRDDAIAKLKAIAGVLYGEGR